MKEYDPIKRKATGTNLHYASSGYKMLAYNDPGSLISTRSSIKGKLLLFIISIKKTHMETCLGRIQHGSNKFWLGNQVTRERESPKH